MCSSSEVSGVEVDNCGPNPNAYSTNYLPYWWGGYPQVWVGLGFGVGVGG